VTDWFVGRKTPTLEQGLAIQEILKTQRRAKSLSIPDGIPFTMLQHPIDPDRRDKKEKQLHFLDLTERLFGLKNQTSLSPTKCRPRTNEGAGPKGASTDRLCADVASANQVARDRFFH